MNVLYATELFTQNMVNVMCILPHTLTQNYSSFRLASGPCGISEARLVHSERRAPRTGIRLPKRDAIEVRLPARGSGHVQSHQHPSLTQLASAQVQGLLPWKVSE